MHRQRHTVIDARTSYVEARRVTAAVHSIHTLRKTLAVQCAFQMRERVCGTAGDMLSARASERKGAMYFVWGKKQNGWLNI